MSGKVALKNLMGACSITGAKVLADELVISGISGRSFRKDQSVLLDDGTTIAHESEACKCFGSGHWYKRDDCFASDASGKTFHNSRKSFSEKSHRCCDETELITCQESGVRLLEDEIGRCSVTMRRISRELLRRCSETGAYASESIMGHCSESGESVLKTSLVELPETKALVRKSLVRRSDYSGRLGLVRDLFRSTVTGKYMLADEIVICPQTNQYAGPGELLTCSETGEQGVPDVFVKSSISSKLYLRKNTKSLPNGHVVGKTETVVCFWSRKYFRASDTAICKLCGLEFEKSLLNASGEFRILRKALDGEATGDDFPDDMFLARLSPKNFSGIKGFQWITSPAKRTHILFGSKSFFGLNAKYFAVMAEGDLSMLHLRGMPLMGKRVRGIWVATE